MLDHLIVWTLVLLLTLSVVVTVVWLIVLMVMGWFIIKDLRRELPPRQGPKLPDLPDLKTPYSKKIEQPPSVEYPKLWSSISVWTYDPEEDE